MYRNIPSFIFLTWLLACGQSPRNATESEPDEAHFIAEDAVGETRMSQAVTAAPGAVPAPPPKTPDRVAKFDLFITGVEAGPDKIISKSFNANDITEQYCDVDQARK